MKKYYFLMIVVLILGLALTGCFLSNVGQVPSSEQSGIAYLTKNGLLTGLVGLWHFSGNTLDSSGNNNDGTVEGGAIYVDNLTMGQALSFDGINDYVRVDHHAELNPTLAITVECWAKLNSVDPGPVLVRKMDTYSLQVTRLGGVSKLEGWVKIGDVWQGVRVVPGGVTIQTDMGYHFAFTYDGFELKTYVNGQLDRSAFVTGLIDFTTKPFDIGRCGPEDGSGEGWYINGIIDEVRIWKVALPQEELGKIYEWEGFFRPIDNGVGVFNVVKAGRAIPVKFSLGGDQGLKIFEVGYPKSTPIVCPAGADVTPDEIATVTAGGSNLSYDAADGQYTYVWKTNEDWTGCRQLIVKLVDGTSHYANFKFK